MKIVLIVIFSIWSSFLYADEIYSSPQNKVDGKYNLSLDKKTYVPEWSPLDWNASCNKDRFNGKKVCSLSKAHSNLMVSIVDGSYSVYVGRDHFPKSQSAIKIDENKPIYGYEGISQTPQKIIEQMKNGKVAYTRYKEWPYEYNRDSETDLTGFAEKFNEMLEEYKKL